MTRIAIIVGSTRPNRNNVAVARWVYEIAEKRSDAVFELVDILDYNLPLLDEPLPPSMGQYGKPHTKRWAEKIGSFDAYIFVTPEYNHGISGALKNAIDWASRPWGQNAFARKPSAVIGASIGAIGTAVSQQNLRSVLSFCDSPQMNAPEAYIHFTPDLVDDEGNVSNPSTEEFLRNYMAEFHLFVTRVTTVLPRDA